MPIVHRVLIYLFPGILLAFEWLLLSLGNTNVAPAIGTSLASGALGLLVPLTTTKVSKANIPEDVLKKLRELNQLPVAVTDRSFSSFCLIMLLAFLAIWAYLAKLSVTHLNPGFFGMPWRWDVIIGATTYVVAAALSEVKEKF